MFGGSRFADYDCDDNDRVSNCICIFPKFKHLTCPDKMQRHLLIDRPFIHLYSASARGLSLPVSQLDCSGGRSDDRYDEHSDSDDSVCDCYDDDGDDDDIEEEDIYFPAVVNSNYSKNLRISRGLRRLKDRSGSWRLIIYCNVVIVITVIIIMLHYSDYHNHSYYYNVMMR